MQRINLNRDTTMTIRKRGKLLLQLAKWAIFTVIGVLALTSVDISSIAGNLRAFSAQTLLIFCGLVTVSHVFYDARLLLTTISLNTRPLRLLFVIRLNLLSEFVSIVLPTYLGGDGLRLLRLRAYTDSRTAAVCVLIDRIVGLLTLGVAALLCLPGLIGVVRLPVQLDAPLIALIGVALVIGGGVGLRFAPALIAKLGLSHIRLQFKPFVLAILLSLIGHMLYTLSYTVLFLSLTDAAPIHVLAITLLALLTRSVPISFLGVEFSDGSLVALVGLIGIDPAIALSVVTVVLGSRYAFALVGLLWEAMTDGLGFLAKTPHASTLEGRLL